MSEGAAAYTETVTVERRSVRAAGAGSLPADPRQRGAAEPARRADRRRPAGGAGVAGRGDRRRLPSEFSVRGSDFAHLNFTVDGFATPFVMHMVRAVEERANTRLGLDDQQRRARDASRCRTADMRSGRATGPARSSGSSIREGSRERNVVRASVSGTSASLTAEGPARPREARLVAGLGPQELSRSDRQEAARGGSELRLRRRAGQAALRPHAEAVGGADLHHRQIASPGAAAAARRHRPADRRQRLRDPDRIVAHGASGTACSRPLRWARRTASATTS